MSSFVDPLEEPFDEDHGIPREEEREWEVHEVPEDSPESDAREASGRDGGAIDAAD